MKSSLDESGFRVKVESDLGRILIYHEEDIYTQREKGIVYGRRSGARIYVGAWFQCLFDLLVVDDTNFAPLDDKVCKGDDVRDVLVLVPSNKGVCVEASDD